MRQGVTQVDGEPVADPWELAMIGTATITSPHGHRVTVCARLFWLLTPEKTIRFMLCLDDDVIPILSITAPSPGAVPALAVPVLAQVLDHATEPAQ